MLSEALAHGAPFPFVGPAGGPAASRIEAEEGVTETDIAGAVLRALATMARASKRQQAELQAALERAGLASLSDHEKQAALRRLYDTASIEHIIPLDDGGVLISVTSAGMERALR